MNNDWRTRIKVPEEKRIFEALADPNWDFRTVAGLARTAGLSEEEVGAVLEKYPDLVRKSAVPAKDGSELYTLRSRGVTPRERLAEARLFITKTAE